MGSSVILVDDFDVNNLTVGSIIWYVNTDITSSVDWHPHVVVGIDGSYCYTVCGTSQQETIERKANALKIDLSAFPAVDPSKENRLRKCTFFDCLDYYEIHKTTIEDRYWEGETMKIEGNVCYSDYVQIRAALIKNPSTDITDLLIHPEDNL